MTTNHSGKLPPQINAIRAIVKIQTPPEYNPVTGEIEPGNRFEFDTREKAFWTTRDILSITTNKQLDQPCGRATLEFTPEEQGGGRTWASMIPSYSLVEIYLQRYPENPQPILVFLGLTDARQQSETYHRDGSLERSVTIAARELSCILIDQRTLYLPAPPSSLFHESTVQLSTVFSEEVQLLGMLAIDPELALVGADPATVIGRFVQMVTTGLETPYNPEGRPLLNLQLPFDQNLGRSPQLSDFLRYDLEKAKAALFDPGAQLPASSQFTLSNSSLWNLMDTFSDPAYQELFSETVDPSFGTGSVASSSEQAATAGYVEIIFRKKPFAGRINAQGELDMTREPTESQFARDFEDDPLNTFEITDEHVVGLELMQSPEGMANLYYVFPQVPDINGPDYRALFPPLVDNAAGSPSSVTRYGPRLIQHADYYFQNLDRDAARDLDRGRTRAKLLWSWYQFNPLFFRGHYTLRGNPLARVGRRMVHKGRGFGPHGAVGSREYYVTNVAHQMSFKDEVRFVTRIGVDRGWPLR